MAGCGSSLFGNGSQFIKINAGDFVAVQGSDTRERLITSDLRMPYRQILKSRVILKPGQANYLLNHLGMGDNATFLGIRVSYDPKSVIEADNYIQWSYYDNLTRINSFAQMMVLTGNSTNRIPQLYLTNANTKYSVILDVMVASIDDSYSFFTDIINQSGTTFTGLEYTDIKTWIINESFVVYDKSTPKRPLIYVNLSNINSIEIDGDILTIDDQSYGMVFLKFLTHFDATQAHSILNYILENPNIDIDAISPITDSISPVIYFFPTAGVGGDYILYNDGITIGATWSTPYNTFDNGFTFSTSISLSTYGNTIYSSTYDSEVVISKQTLIDLLIDHIEDNRDGLIDIMPSELIISGSDGIVNYISTIGTYSISFDFSDIAENKIGDVNVNLNITS